MKIGQNNCEIVRVNTSGIPKIEEVLHNKLACYIIRIIFLQNILLSCNLNPFEWGGGRRWPSTGIKGKVKLVRKMQTCSSILQKSDSWEFKLWSRHWFMLQHHPFHKTCFFNLNFYKYWIVCTQGNVKQYCCSINAKNSNPNQRNAMHC